MNNKSIIVPVSGGKDSQVTLSMALSELGANRNVVAVHQSTGFDHPFTYEHMKAMEEFYKITIHVTVSKYGDMFGFLEHAGYFPNSAARGCTQRLKQEPFADWLCENGFNPDNAEIWFGMRKDESSTRSSKYGHLTELDEIPLKQVSSFYGQKRFGDIGNIWCFMPVVDFTTDEIFDYLLKEGAKVNPLYKKGHHRVGCYPCLLSRKAEWQAAAKDETGIKHINRMLELEERWLKDGNHRKYIKVHRFWDVRKFLDGESDDLPDLFNECSYCG